MAGTAASSPRPRTLHACSAAPPTTAPGARWRRRSEHLTPCSAAAPSPSAAPPGSAPCRRPHHGLSSTLETATSSTAAAGLYPSKLPGRLPISPSSPTRPLPDTLFPDSTAHLPSSSRICAQQGRLRSDIFGVLLVFRAGVVQWPHEHAQGHHRRGAQETGEVDAAHPDGPQHGGVHLRPSQAPTMAGRPWKA